MKTFLVYNTLVSMKSGFTINGTSTKAFTDGIHFIKNIKTGILSMPPLSSTGMKEALFYRNYWAPKKYTPITGTGVSAYFWIMEKLITAHGFMFRINMHIFPSFIQIFPWKVFLSNTMYRKSLSAMWTPFF